jgi:hypothetical protein
MSQMRENTRGYRGYTLLPVKHAPGWRVHIYPDPRHLPTQPNHVAAVTKEGAFTKARAVVDGYISR